MSTTRRKHGEGGASLSVDHELCSGTGHCQEAVPELFRLRDRQAWLAEDADLTAVGEERLRRAEAACPWFAVTYRPAAPDAPADEAGGARPPGRR